LFIVHYSLFTVFVLHLVSCKIFKELFLDSRAYALPSDAHFSEQKDCKDNTFLRYSPNFLELFLHFFSTNHPPGGVD